MILFDAVSKRYDGDQDALRDVSMEVAAGEFVFLTGHSGAGKSTILRLIALIEHPSRGQIVVDGRNTARISARELPYYRRQIGMIFQDHRLLPDRTVFDNVALPLVVAGHSPLEISKRVRAALDKVGLLSKERRLPPALSSGEQQRVGIARAVVNRPKLLLADEPTGNLDPALSREILRLFGQFHQVGVTVVIATHDIGLINQVPARTIALRDGNVVRDTHATLEALP
ncbi:MAG: cell division ATP-binding protein FtsE [Gammaproteobacteria bacterium]|nr:cell division ATP-binding protein FtsE [Gammaproteobacteria bacterium]